MPILKLYRVTYVTLDWWHPETHTVDVHALSKGNAMDIVQFRLDSVWKDKYYAKEAIRLYG